jgi:phosphoserine aminotransferase
MSIPAKPSQRPRHTHFSSGPCAKRPGWNPAALSDAAVGRSHRGKLGKGKIVELVARSRAILGLPDDYLLGIVPASDTGAMEMAMWSLLGPRGIDVLAWESFGQGWVTDITKQLRLPDVRVMSAPYGEIPDLAQVDFARDVVFTWNGTTSGVRVPDGDWVSDRREGLVITDATSAAFAMPIPWRKIDVATWSWQKVLGGEGAHGMLALGPRAVARLESWQPSWPMPKIFRMTSGGKLMRGIFEGDTINTPSLLCVEDQLDALRWAESVGGLPGLVRRSEANLAVLEEWVARSEWAQFLAADPKIRSSTSICLTIEAPWFQALPPDEQSASAKRIAAGLEREGVAFDTASYRDTPPGLRIWGGATVEADDIRALTPWLDWAYAVEAAGRAA